MKISSYDIMPFNDADTFEDFCCDLWKAVWQYPGTQKHGRKGQTQSGVDVYGIPEGKTKFQGIQCKCRSNFLDSKLTEKEITHEINEAKKFTPKLEHLIIATTAPSDVNLQAFVRLATQNNKSQGLFSVTVLGWREILLILDEHVSVAKKYFPNMYLTDSLSKKQEALLVEQNPTLLEITNIRSQHFLGDAEPYLTLEIKNTSKLVAREIGISIIAAKQNGQAQSEEIKFTPSKCLDIKSIPGYAIASGTTQLIPFAPESEAYKLVGGDCTTHRLIGVGFSANVPDELIQKIREYDQSLSLRMISIKTIAFCISLKWSSILEQKMNTTFAAFLYLLDEHEDI